jgi:hypothetical protein
MVVITNGEAVITTGEAVITTGSVVMNDDRDVSLPVAR